MYFGLFKQLIKYNIHVFFYFWEELDARKPQTLSQAGK